MVLRFYFPFLQWSLASSLYSIIALSIYISVNFLIIKSGFSQNHEVKNPKLLVYAGIINIISETVKIFLPRLIMYEFTQKEYFFYKIYNFFLWSIYPLSSLISFGLLFYIFGTRNKEIFGNYLIVASILIVAAFSLNLITNFIFFAFILDYYVYYPGFSIKNNPIWYIYFALIELSITIIILGFIFLLIHSKKFGDKFITSGFIIFIIRSLTLGYLRELIYLVFGG